MIKINLLPPQMRAEQKKATAKAAAPPPTIKPMARDAQTPSMSMAMGLGEVGKKLLILFSAAVAVLLLVVYLVVVLLPTWWQGTRISSWKKQWKPLEEEYNKIDALSQQKDKDAQVLNEVKDHVQGRVRWARILNAISDVVPSSVQLTRIGVSNVEEMVPAQAPPPSKKSKASASSKAPLKAAPPPMVKCQVAVVEMEGVVTKGVLGDEDIKILLDQCRAHSVFKELFSGIDLVEVGTLSDMTKRFFVRCRFHVIAKQAEE